MTTINPNQMFLIFLIAVILVITAIMIRQTAQKRKRLLYINAKKAQKENRLKEEDVQKPVDLNLSERPVEWEDLAVKKIINLKSLQNSNDNIIIESLEVSTADLLKETYSSGPLGQILVVDDALVVRRKIGNLLQENNYSYALQKDGQFAIEYLSYLIDHNMELPDVVITDLEMPKVDGIELISWLRKNDKCRNLPVIVVSSHLSLQKLFSANNIQGFISKPFEDKDLLSQIEYLLENNY